MAEPLRFMMIEDSESDFRLVERALRKLGSESVCIRVDRASALDEALQHKNWSAVLCDYNVPNMSFCKNLEKIISQLPDTPLILVSGDVGIEQATDLLKQGVWDFVLKDNLARLPSILERALHEAADHQARNQAEAALRLSEERLRLAVEGASLGTWHLDVVAGTAFLSDLCCSIFGCAPGTQLVTDTFVQLVHPDDRDAVEADLRQSLLTGQDYSTEYRIVLPDGSERWIASKAGVQRSEGGQVISMEGVVQDITVRKKAEQVLLLEKKIAEAANRAKNEFLAMISHELRTPLNGIFGGVQLLHLTNLDAEQQEYLDMIDVSVGNELSLVNDLLDLAQIEAGGLSVVSKEFSLSQCVIDTVRIQKLQAQSRGLELSEDILPGLPEKLLGDPLRLRQILLNLLGNAIKFTDQGHVVLKVQAVGDGVHDAVMVRFSVTDTGIGIALADLERIFDPFVQADMSNSRQYGGAGLGLSICRRLAGMLGGRIWVESQLGSGSTFHLELPFSRTDGEQPEVVAEPELSSQNYTILLVDDDYYSLKVNSSLLEKLGHHVVTATNGKEAVEAYQRQSFDLVLMDIQMPVMTGVDALEAIRNLENEHGTTHTPIIAQTAYAMPADRPALLAAGFDGYLAKPLLLIQVKQEFSRVMEG